MQRPRRLFCAVFWVNAVVWQQLLCRYLCSVALSFISASLPLIAIGQSVVGTVSPAFQDNMDGQAPVLQPLTAGTSFRVGQRTVDRKLFRHGSGAEKILLRGPAGQAAHLAYSIPPAPVIQELRFRADLVTNRPGVQMAARIVLPRSSDRSTGRPFELLVRGGTIGSGGDWEELTLDNLPLQLANHARVARAQYGAALDERGAFVSQIVFLTPGGAGMTELIVDRIRVFGVVSQQPRINEPPANAQQAHVPSATADLDREFEKRYSRVPRIIQWQGEPFELLQQLGFNTIGMGRLPTTEELQQIDQLGLMLFCPPPTPKQLSDGGIAAELNSVLAWNLGEQLSSNDLEYVERWERQISRHDAITKRPTVLAPQLYTLEASRIADVMLVGRPVVGTGLTIREHMAWLTQRQRLVRSGSPIWTNIETQPSPNQLQQMAALSATGASAQETSYSQLTALTSASLGIKTRGFYFQSQAPLSSEDSGVAQKSDTSRRALALELTNLRLQLAEPWLTAGKELSSARSSKPELSALLMQVERSRLLAPIWWSLDMQSSVHPRTTGPVSFIVPGVAESSEAFLITLGGMQRVRHRRVTGGIRISLEQLPFDSFLMLSDDQQAIAQVSTFLRHIAPRATKIRRELANIRLGEVAGLVARMKNFAANDSRTQVLLKRAQGELAACDRYLSAKSFELAYLSADAVDLSLDELVNDVQSAAWSAKPQATMYFNSGYFNSGAMDFPDRLQLDRMLARAPVGSNLLTGGGFESLSALLDNGWRHQQLQLDGITTSVRLSPEAPHSGSYCLELEARAIDESGPVVIVPTSPVWIVSAPLDVRGGDLLEITGVARLPEPLLGSVDGLQIIDSLGGPDMALRIHEAPSWQPFRLIRAVTSDAQVTVTVALSGLGRAQIDDVAIRIVQKK